MKRYKIFLLLLNLIFVGNIASAQVCPDPVFQTNWQFFEYGGLGQTPATLAQNIRLNYPNKDWCYTTELCPVNAYNVSTQECGIPPESVIQKWKEIVNLSETDLYQGFFRTGTNPGAYYTKKICSICISGQSAGASTLDVPATNPSTLDVPATNPSTLDVPALGNQNVSVTLGFDKLENPLGPAKLTTVSDVIERALGIIIKISIPFVVLMLIWTGFQFVIAQGNESKITAAKRSLMWVIVGAAILIGCVAIANAIANSIETVAKVAGQ